MDELVKRLRREAVYLPEKFSKNAELLNVLMKAADAIEVLSRRETPIRVRLTTSTTRCPSCNKQLTGRGNIHRNYRFCRWCGQAIDWSESPKEE